ARMRMTVHGLSSGMYLAIWRDTSIFLRSRSIEKVVTGALLEGVGSPTAIFPFPSYAGRQAATGRGREKGAPVGAPVSKVPVCGTCRLSHRKCPWVLIETRDRKSVV